MMPDISLKPNQAALVLESSDNGDINVEVAISKDESGENVLSAALCKIIAKKLISDEQFQSEIMNELDRDLE